MLGLLSMPACSEDKKDSTQKMGGLVGLRELILRDTNITDAGLAHLKGLTGLRELLLANTKITRLAALRKALPKTRIYP